MGGKYRTYWVLGAAVALSLAFEVATVSPVAAEGKKVAEAPNVASLATLLEGFSWGMDEVKVADVHNRVNGIFDKDYDPILRKMQPGVRMDAVERERDNLKTALRASLLEFKDTPTGHDTTGRRGEYSYKNKEALQYVQRGGKMRYFFYIGAPRRLWKIYDEVPLSETGPYGKTFQEAREKTATLLGVKGAPRPADAAKGFPLPYIEWADATTHLRLVDRSNEGIVAVVLEDKAMLASLPQIRVNKLDDPMAIDPAILAITKGGISDPNAKVDGGRR